MTTDTKQANVLSKMGLLEEALKVWRFAWHLVQMVLAMAVGMVIYHVLVGKAPAEYRVLWYAGMELSMIPPMIALMIVQRHGWRHSAEMAAVMLVGPALFLTCAQLGLHTYIPGLSRDTLLGLSDATMYAGMLGAMIYRRDLYTRRAAHSSHTTSPTAGPSCH